MNDHKMNHIGSYLKSVQQAGNYILQIPPRLWNGIFKELSEMNERFLRKQLAQRVSIDTARITGRVEEIIANVRILRNGNGETFKEMDEQLAKEIGQEAALQIGDLLAKEDLRIMDIIQHNKTS